MSFGNVEKKIVVKRLIDIQENSAETEPLHQPADLVKNELPEPGMPHARVHTIGIQHPIAVPLHRLGKRIPLRVLELGIAQRQGQQRPAGDLS